MSRSDTIKRLMEEIRTLEQSDRNKERIGKWQGIPKTSRDLQWRGLPKTDYSWKTGEIPVEVEMNWEFWAKYFNFSLKDFYLDPEVYLESYLKFTIERFKLFDDDVFISKRIPLNLATGFEASFFGMKINFFDDIDPWIEHRPMVKDHNDLEKLRIPELKTAGLMPVAFRLYEYVKETVDDDFEVFFPEWIRGPFGMATYLRGFEDILIDMYEEPEFFHELMRIITDARKQWYIEIEKYLGMKYEKTNLFNDEVNCPTVSPALYEELVLPYEIELCNTHPGGFHYWHSCGDISRIYPAISKIPQIDLIHRGPWSSNEEIAKNFGDRSAFEVCMHPQRDIFEADFEGMKANLKNAIDTFYKYNVKGFTFRANTLGISGSIDYSVTQAKEWVKAARAASECIPKQYY